MSGAKRGENMDKEKTKSEKKSEKGKGMTEVTYVKFKAMFMCSKEECDNVWESAHGWSEEEDVLCKLCESKCEVMNVKDENMTLDNYECRGGHRWQAIHDDTVNQQECEECGGMGTKDGSQMRFGRHFWYKCFSKTCGATREDFALTPQRTQWCAKREYDPLPQGGTVEHRCGGRGYITKIGPVVKKKGQPKSDTKENAIERVDWEDSGPHNTRLCDMCRDLKKKGFQGTCMTYRKLKCEILKTGEKFHSIERIIEAIKIKN